MNRLVLILLAFCVPTAAVAGPAPRAPLPAAPVVAPTDSPALAMRLVVKFGDDVRARAHRGQLRSEMGVDLSGVHAALADSDAEWRPLIGLDSAALSRLEARAEARSGVAQPDLAGMLIVRIDSDDPGSLESLGERLQSEPTVERAWIEPLGLPPPGDLWPTTPDHEPSQTFFAPDPGIDADYAWMLGAGRGASIRVSDCEYGWVATHEDLADVDLHPEPAQTVWPEVAFYGWDQHGAAVMGELVSPSNGYGVRGLLPDAELHTFPEWTVEEGYRRVTAITAAAMGSLPGDVLMLEMQGWGAGGDFAPAEVDPGVWTVTRVATDAGIVVVAAAGNGAQDLDSAPYAPYRSAGDSGAILVGAGSADTGHHALPYTTFGERVDVQGWGEDVFTLGYGDYASYGGPDDVDQFYTAAFAGTSAATPLVVAAAAVVQAVALERTGLVLGPEALREHLVSSGIPQGGGGHVGPLVNLRAAIDQLPDPDGPDPDEEVDVEDAVVDVDPPARPGADVVREVEHPDLSDLPWLDLPPPDEPPSEDVAGRGCAASVVPSAPGGLALLLLLLAGVVTRAPSARRYRRAAFARVTSSTKKPSAPSPTRSRSPSS